MDSSNMDVKVYEVFTPKKHKDGGETVQTSTSHGNGKQTGEASATVGRAASPKARVKTATSQMGQQGGD